jgi:lipopolysaccharide/colanic/teichoic acid biosynthesis glycosyltransferase
VTAPRRRQPARSPRSKRALDVVLASVVLLLASPVLVLIALAVRLDSPGPVLLRQERTGLDGTRFTMFKFRTMVANAEELKSELLHLNVLPWPDFKIPDDPRITRVGRWLRSSSLDELPQLVNVVRGEMSLVGPRPTSFACSQYEPWHGKRLEVLPGVTGYWQTRGRNTTSFDERLRLDIAYIDERSFLVDVRVLCSTAAVVIRRTGA